MPATREGLPARGPATREGAVPEDACSCSKQFSKSSIVSEDEFFILRELYFIELVDFFLRCELYRDEKHIFLNCI